MDLKKLQASGSDLEPERQVVLPALGQRAGQWGMAGAQAPRAAEEQGCSCCGGDILSPCSWAWLRGGQDRGRDTWAAHRVGMNLKNRPQCRACESWPSI